MKSIRLGTCVATVALLSCSSAPQPPASAPDEGAAAGLIPAPPLQAKSLPGDFLQVTTHRLTNGMTVIISPNADAPVIKTNIIVRAGSANDPADSTGLAHYLEHMMFKGTSRIGTTDITRERPHLDAIAQLYRKMREPNADLDAIRAAIDAETQAAAPYVVPNELAALYQALGFSELNGITHDDATQYVVTIPSNKLKAWAEIEAERFRDPVFRLFWPELEIVYQEKNGGLTYGYWLGNTASDAALFPAHGYGQSAYGSIEHLKIPAYDNMVDYFKQWYVPENMAIVLCGDVTPETALPVLEEAFAEFRPPLTKRPPMAKPAPLAASQLVQLTVPSSPHLSLSWQGPPANHPDYLAFDLVSRLWQEKILDNLEAGGYTFLETNRDASILNVYFSPLEDQAVDEVAEVAKTAVADLLAIEFTQADLQAQALAAEYRFNRISDDNASRMEVLADAYEHNVPWATFVNQAADIARLTPADLKRVAATYLQAPHVEVRAKLGDYVANGITAPSITPLTIDATRRSTFAQAVTSRSYEPLPFQPLIENEHYTRQQLATGPAILVPNKRNQLYKTTWKFAYGSDQDPALCLALQALQQVGTQALSKAELAAQRAAVGNSVYYTCSAREVTIDFAGMAKYYGDARRLLDQQWHDLAITPEALRASVNTIRANRAGARNLDQAVADAALRHAQNPAFVETKVRAPSSQLATYTVADVQQTLRTLHALQHTTIHWGPIDMIASLDFGTGTATPSPQPAFTVAPAAVQTYQLTPFDHANTTIQLFFPAGDNSIETAAMGRLYHHMTSGMTSVLFQELRESRALVYTTEGYVQAGDLPRDTWVAVATAETQADKTETTVATMLEALRRPLTPTQFEQIKSAMLSNHRAQRTPSRDIGELVGRWLRRDAHQDPRPKIVERASAITLGEFNAWKQAKLAAPVITLIGPRDAASLRSLTGTAPVHTVNVDDLMTP